MENLEFISKDQYPSVLNAKHIQRILGIGERQTYELLNSGQFHTVKVGRMIKVSKDIFLKWLEG
ncbi:helix-turn-helix domain-containing protein [Paenibacillus crassostreae]|uniref:DNA-binding protein n=1 Tax=Paenibacillus crassostreae TaxID=1763538 RepID=A0A167C6P8_9BACL|nr:helix-turn-helix domain-containing protein [Paenibacillus crassostreae]AOZ91580.1 DNA-binding protein [Paenibacillus crassostreae]OAB72846.1 DNA-binding protein [Paenibacillus crassostreae]